MTQKAVACILALVLLVAPLTIPNAKADTPTIAPFNLLSMNAELSKSGTELRMYVRFLYISAESTYFNVSLQHYDGGKWTTWNTYSDVRNDQGFVFEKKVSPPKGYTYRLKVTGSSPSFPGFEFYSNEFFY